MDIVTALPFSRSNPAPLWLSEAWAVPCTEHGVDIDGTRINYRAWNLERTDLPAMVLVHGFRAHARWWDHIAPFFAEDHRVIALDLSGMGDSGHRDTYSRRGFGQDILGVIADAGFVRPAIVAHSFGGVATWMAVVAAPEMISRIILVDSILEIFEGLSYRQIPVLPLRTYTEKEQALLRFRLIPPGQWPDPHILSYIAENSVMLCKEGWTWKFDNRIVPGMNADVRYDLPQINLPVDYIYGDRSQLLSRSRIDRILANLPSCDRVIAIPASDHHILIEQPLALIAAVRTLLS